MHQACKSGLHAADYASSKSSRTSRLERELQMIQLSATRCSCIAILWDSLVSFAAILFVLLLNVCLFLFISLWLSSETFGYTLVHPLPIPPMLEISGPLFIGRNVREMN
jgi:hypothetical protein